MQKKSSLFSLILTLILASIAFGQTVSEPRTESLLNELKVQIFTQKGTGKMSVLLRLHRGSAFDPEGKDGAMSLLSEVLFPEVETRNFFQNELGGDFKINTNHDYIEIVASCDQEHFVTMLETLASQMTNPVIDADTIKRGKENQLAKIKAQESDLVSRADNAAAKNLFGSYPYGRSLLGTNETINAITFADLVFLKQRFIAADNATIAVKGDMNSSFAYRAVRRIFGAWQKRTEKVPVSFRLPGDPEKTATIIETSAGAKPFSTFEIVAVDRPSGDFFAAQILNDIMSQRAKLKPELGVISVGQRANLLRGVFIANTNSGAQSSFSPFVKLLGDPIAQVEFDSAKARVIRNFYANDPASLYLDLDTYGLGTIKSQIAQLEKASIADVMRIANDVKTAPFAVATVTLKPATEAKMQNTDPKDPR